MRDIEGWPVKAGPVTQNFDLAHGAGRSIRETLEQSPRKAVSYAVFHPKKNAVCAFGVGSTRSALVVF